MRLGVYYDGASVSHDQILDAFMLHLDGTS